MSENKKRIGNYWYAIVFVAINLFAILVIRQKELRFIDTSLAAHAENSMKETEQVMQNYTHSFRLFAQLLSREIRNNPDPDDIWDFLKSIDPVMLEIEGDTFDGLYMFYQNRYLYSWNTPYSEYESTGYVAQERPWYKDALQGGGSIVFTPPYMSYANHYILSTISQLQPDRETVFAYDIKMGDIQKLVTTLQEYKGELMMIYDANGTVIGSTNTDYLGGSFSVLPEEAAASVQESREALENGSDLTDSQREKLEEQIQSDTAFLAFRQNFDAGLSRLKSQNQKALRLKIENKSYYGYLLKGDQYNFLVLVPMLSMFQDSVQVWLLPLLLLELLLVYLLSRISKDQRNRELKAAYVELGQTQRRLEIALKAAQKAAAIDDLTGMMNFKSFRKGVTEQLEEMTAEESAILIMIDGDHFKAINDNYGHSIGDEVIKLTAQMIIGRIRTTDLASRLHGDEFAIFVSNTGDYSVAKRIMEDINSSIAVEASKRNMPAITISSGAVIAHKGDNYAALAKAADAALYEAKETHNGGFAGAK